MNTRSIYHNRRAKSTRKRTTIATMQCPAPHTAPASTIRNPACRPSRCCPPLRCGLRSLPFCPTPCHCRSPFHPFLPPVPPCYPLLPLMLRFRCPPCLIPFHCRLLFPLRFCLLCP